MSYQPRTLATLLGQRIATLRTDRRLTQEQLAYGAGKSKGYLSLIEQGKRLPSLTFLVALAALLKVELRDMFIFPERSPIDKAMDLVRMSGVKFAAKVLSLRRYLITICLLLTFA